MKNYTDENNYPLFDGLVGLKQKHMKTAMQELIERLEEKRDMWDKETKSHNEIKTTYQVAIIVAKNLIEKEKEQKNKIIRDVFEHCWNHLNWSGEYDIKDMEDYLKTYNQNK